MKHSELITIVVFVFAECFSAMTARADSGVYLGGGLGKTKIQDSTGNPQGVLFDQYAGGLKVFAGYHFDAIPIVKFDAEVGYRELGRVDYRIHGPDYGLLAGVGLGPVELFGRAGAMRYKLEKNTLGGNHDFDGTAPVYGVGAKFTVLRVGIRAELERIDIQELDRAYMLSISVLYQF
jgi:opacity protein-like surface antigen